MADIKDTSKGIAQAVDRLKDVVAKEAEQHKGEDINLEDLEDVSGGWAIYFTDPKPKLEELA